MLNKHDQQAQRLFKRRSQRLLHSFVWFSCLSQPGALRGAALASLEPSILSNRHGRLDGEMSFPQRAFVQTFDTVPPDYEPLGMRCLRVVYASRRLVFKVVLHINLVSDGVLDGVSRSKACTKYSISLPETNGAIVSTLNRLALAHLKIWNTNKWAGQGKITIKNTDTPEVVQKFKKICKQIIKWNAHKDHTKSTLFTLDETHTFYTFPQLHTHHLTPQVSGERASKSRGGGHSEDHREYATCFLNALCITDFLKESLGLEFDLVRFVFALLCFLFFGSLRFVELALKQIDTSWGSVLLKQKRKPLWPEIRQAPSRVDVFYLSGFWVKSSSTCFGIIL